MKAGLSLLLFLWLCRPVYAQAVLPLSGARSEALAGSGIAMADPWSLQHNPGLLSLPTVPELASTAQLRFGLSELNALALAGTLPLQQQGLAFSLNRFGFGPLSWQQLRLAWGHRIGPYGLGISANLWQAALEGYETLFQPSLDAGGFAELGSSLRIGAAISHLKLRTERADMAGMPELRLRLGLCWQIDKQLMGLAEIDKQEPGAARLRAGLAYRIHPALEIRTGMATQPALFSLGLGWQYKSFTFDYGGSYQLPLGLIHQFGLGIKLKQL